MSLIGKTLGHYKIGDQPLGRGGMGEVYRARDLKLGRDVATKVLPEAFSRDADRVARFQREAKLLASLNHPNIAAIYGIEEFGGIQFLVLELVEGETLAEQLKRGPIPVEESLKLALQIAEALEAAHEKGVIHRDLKPANIKVTPEGKVKVLDFGLAKALAGEQQEATLTYSPTLSELATQRGVILGTAAYMSPEQAKGKTVDKRADIWAFGVVLFEMLTGSQLFIGETISEILAAVLKSEPDWNLLPASLHPRLRLLLERCLEKESKSRYHDIADARVDIQKVLADPKGVLVQPVTTVEPRRKLRAILPRVAAAIILGSIITGMAVWELKPTPPPEPRQVMRFDYDLPEGQKFSSLSLISPSLAVSPDAKQFVYSTPKGLYLRSVDDLTAKLINGTEGETEQPFFSPDGKWIGYFSVDERKLKKIALTGGTPVTLCAVTKLAGAWWSADDTIVYGQYPGQMMRISANGGTPESFVKSVKAQFGIPSLPQILPNGKSVLYTLTSGTGRSIRVVSPESGESRQLVEGSNAKYLPTGHIVYESSNSIYAIRFDLSSLKVSSSPVLLVEGVKCAAVSDAGTLVYIPQTTSALPEDAAGPGRTLVWVDRKGKEEAIPAPQNLYRTPKISPDGTRVAITIRTAGSNDIWIWDLVRKTLTQLTFEGRNMQPLWTRDSTRIAFYSDELGNYKNGGRVFWKAADGTGQNDPLSSKLDLAFFPCSWSGDAKTLVGVEWTDVRADIGMLSMEGDHSLKHLLQTVYYEQAARLYPDGRWMAYVSDQSNPNAVRDIHVCSFPDVKKGHWQISNNGAHNPLWSSDGRELFYIGDDDAVMAVAVKTDPHFSTVGPPQILFKAGAYVTNQSGEYPPWDISPDGKRFVMIKRPPSKGDVSAAEEPRKINIVLNWFEELKQRVPVK